MKKYDKLNIKKTQVLTILSVVIMILVSFTTVTSEPVFESASDSDSETADDTNPELDYVIPEYIDCSSLSKETLDEIQKISDYVKDLLVVADDYDVELPFTTVEVPVMVNGLEFTTMIFPMNIGTTGQNWTCTNLAIRITIYKLIAVGALTSGLIGFFLIFWSLAEDTLAEYYALGCGDGSDVQSLLNGEILEISEVYAILDNLDQNCGI
jgi:hypothetical protein